LKRESKGRKPSYGQYEKNRMMFLLLGDNDTVLVYMWRGGGARSM